MSGLDFRLADNRASIVAALNGLTASVGGQLVTITALPGQPKVVERYQAWPVWVNAVPYTRCLAETYWQVVVSLPAGDEAAMVDAANGLVSLVGDALFDLGQVSAVRPARLLVAGDDVGVPIMQFEMMI